MPRGLRVDLGEASLLARTPPVPRTPPAPKDIHPGWPGWPRGQLPSAGAGAEGHQLKGPRAPAGAAQAQTLGVRRGVI